MTGRRESEDRDTTGPWSVPEAADRLGITASAARKRAQRLADGRDVTGITRAEKDDAGEWVVWIDPEAVEPTEAVPDSALVAELRARIATLEDALADARSERDSWRLAHEREQVLLGQAQSRVLELEDEQSESRPWWRRLIR